MIDKKTVNLLDTFLTESMQQVLDGFHNGSCNMMQGSSKIKDKQYNQFILVTISSIPFKCLVLLHFQNSKEFQDFIFDTIDDTNKNNVQFLNDRLSEMCNEITGALKRKIELSYAVIGMSTPTVLDQSAMDFFLKGKFSYYSHIEANLDISACLGASLFLYVDKKHEFLLRAPDKSEESLDSGELMFF